MISSDLCYNGHIKFDLWKNDKCSDGSKTMLNVNEFSKHYQVKKLNNKDVDDIYNLCLSKGILETSSTAAEHVILGEKMWR